MAISKKTGAAGEKTGTGKKAVRAKAAGTQMSEALGAKKTRSVVADTDKAMPLTKAQETTPQKAGRKKKALSASELTKLRENLLALRARLLGQVDTLKHESLQRFDSVNNEEDGTDAFDRQFALSLASSENESIIEIDEALLRIDEDIYGACEGCGCAIELPRLRALPFAKNCVECQSKTERPRMSPGIAVRFRR